MGKFKDFYTKLVESNDSLTQVITSATNVEELQQKLDNHKIDQGRYGMVFDFGNDFILKVTEDSAYKVFAHFCYTQKPFSTNSLYPEINQYFELPDGGIACLVERIKPIIKLPNAYYIEEFVELVLTEEEIPDVYLNMEEELGFTKKQLIQFGDEIEQFGKDDIQVNNMGIREDGSLVIFDPVKP